MLYTYLIIWNYGTFVPIGGTFAPWYFHSLELSFPGTFVPWNFRSLELSLPGAKVRGNESSSYHYLPHAVVVVCKMDIR